MPGPATNVCGSVPRGRECTSTAGAAHHTNGGARKLERVRTRAVAIRRYACSIFAVLDIFSCSPLATPTTTSHRRAELDATRHRDALRRSRAREMRGRRRKTLQAGCAAFGRSPAGIACSPRRAETSRASEGAMRHLVSSVVSVASLLLVMSLAAQAPAPKAGNEIEYFELALPHAAKAPIPRERHPVEEALGEEPGQRSGLVRSLPLDHGVRENAFLRSADFCGTCHNEKTARQGRHRLPGLPHTARRGRRRGHGRARSGQARRGTAYCLTGPCDHRFHHRS